ncbi:MAG: type II toxin-antitoxin system RelE/ParE family toxin [Gammaproteobacteria bacterium]|nr:type II toxin-antitoxin system RelE/ParE family toxin [Gammaproteobacteria bacterium]
MAQIIWTEPALTDLNDIASYIALDKITAAEKLVQQVFKSVERLEQFPDSGREPPELENTKYQEIIVGPCRIFFRQQNSFVYILYVMRSERKLRKYIINARANNET